MGQVVDFAAHKQDKQDTKRLDNLKEVLKEIHGHLSDAYSQIAQMETECDKVQEAYDYVLNEYIGKVGFAAVDMEYLDYSTRIGIYISDEGDVKIEWRELE